MSGLSERFIDDVMTFYAVTTKFDTGVATDADAVPAYRVYEDETATPILTGNMALLDAANTAGMYSEQITLSAANGFEVGKSYAIHIAATVNSVAGATVKEFVVRKKPLTPTTEGRELDVTTTGGAGIDWANVENPTTALNLSATNIDVDQVVASVSGAVGSVTGNVGGNVVGTVAGVTPSTAAQVAAILTTQITEAYRANGAAPTLAQFMSEVLAHLGEASISTTTKTINKLDHLTAAATFTLDSATDPSSITRAT